MSGEVDTTTGVLEGIENRSGVLDATSGTIIDGLGMERMDTGFVREYQGGRYCGMARIIKGTDAGVAQAVAGDRVALLKKGTHEGYDSEDDTLKLGQPVKPTGTAGEYRLWVGGTDYVDNLAGYVDRLKDANKKILIRIGGGV